MPSKVEKQNQKIKLKTNISDEAEKILSVKKLNKSFKGEKKEVHAVKDLSFDLYKGEIIGIIGESGSGKSTVLKLLTGLLKPSAGSIELAGRNIGELKGRERRFIYHNIQMVFQNPVASFDPRIKLKKSLRDNVCELCPHIPVSLREELIKDLLAEVGIPAELLERYPRELSGGQCQRVAIARALSTSPKILLCDEATSALDVSAQARVIKLLSQINQESGVAMIFVSHDLALASNFCQNLIVMKDGVAVEKGKTEDIFKNPQHDYTKKLLDAVVDPITYLKKKKAAGET